MKILYQVICKKLIEYANPDKSIRYLKVKGILGSLFHIPKETRKDIIKEMIKQKYLIKINSDLLKIIYKEKPKRSLLVP